MNNLFDFPKFEIKNKIRLIELFAGVGSQAMALRDIGADFEHYKVCEFDKYAIASYNAIHGTNFETSDITKLKGKDLEIEDTDKYRIRKLTPRECFRLMGFTDADFEKAAAVNSNTQLYKQAGNSIVKHVLMAIFQQMVVKK